MSWCHPRRLTRRLRWNIPIGLQLSCVFAALLIVILAVLGGLVYLQNDQFLVQTQAAQLEQHTVQVITQFVTNEMANPRTAAGNTADEAAKVVESLGSANDVVFVFAANRHLLAQSYNSDILSYPVLPQAPATWPYLGLHMDDQRLVPMTQRIMTLPSQQRGMVLITPVNLVDEGLFQDRLLIIEQVISLQTTDTMLARLRLYLVVSMLACVVIGVLAGQKLTQVLLRPLGSMVKTAAVIATGDLDQRLRLPVGRNEMARLGQSFDHMVDRLAALVATQRRFVADASHELRTPLTSLQALNELLLMGADQGDYQQILRAAHLSYNEIGRLNRLVGDMLMLSRLDSDIAITKSASLVHPLLVEVCEQMQAQVESRQLELCLVGDAAVMVDVAADQFKQVIINLVDNALRHAFPHGRVVIDYALDVTNQTVRLDVIDNGSGIDAVDLPHIFARFYRGDRSRHHATGNSGLGLAIVQGIILAHGGTIAVASTPGVETRFTMVLPAGNI